MPVLNFQKVFTGLIRPHIVYQDLNFMYVNTDAKFEFKALCPYCKGNLVCIVTGWDYINGLWQAGQLESYCYNMPNEADPSSEWKEWDETHGEMPYVYQLPVDLKVLDFINKHFRFLV